MEDEPVETIIQKKYEKLLQPQEYLTFKLKGLKNYSFWFENLHEFFSTQQFTGGRLFDLGSGSTVHNIGSASKYFPEIILSDLVDRNREALRKWIRKDPDRLDWTPFLQMVAKAENRDDIDAAVQEMEERIRKSVKEVIYCNLYKDPIIAEEYTKEPFDVVLTALTLQTAATNVDSYVSMIGSIKPLLKKGGKLIMIGTTKATRWDVAEGKVFYSLPLDENDIQKALQKHGYEDITIKLSPQLDPDLPLDCENLYFVTSTKV